MQNYRLYLRAKNILNSEARPSTSFTKDIAPLPGRSLVAGVQALF
jgi:iron complex outermembrane receptor protein